MCDDSERQRTVDLYQNERTAVCSEEVKWGKSGSCMGEQSAVEEEGRKGARGGMVR